MEHIPDDLNNIKKSGLYRELKVVENAQDTHVEIEGKTLLSFCSNNYLGLAKGCRSVRPTTSKVKI